MVRICQFIETLNMGGLEIIVKNIALNLDKSEYYQEVWCLKDKGELAKDIERAGITVRPFYHEGGLDIGCLMRLTRALKERRFDVIHSHGFFSIIWGTIIGFLAGIPIRIATCGNCYYDKGQKDRLKFRFLGHFITHFAAVSDAVKRSVVEFMGIPSSRVSIVHNSSGKIEPVSPEDSKKIREKLGIKDTDFVVLSVGRLVEHKGHNYAIEALSMLRHRIPGIKYIIVGDGPAREVLQSKAKNLDLEDIVLFAGSKRDVTDFLGIADVFAQPSALKEGLPVTLTEAASAGIPMIATDIGGNCEIVMNGINGFVVPPKDAAMLAEKVLHLFENPDKRKVMGNNARSTWREKFTLEKMLDKYSAIYRLGTGRAKRRRSEIENRELFDMIVGSFDADLSRQLESYLRKEAMLPFISGKKDILEIGCGRSILSSYLALCGHNVTAIDRNRDDIIKAAEGAKKYSAKVNFKTCDALKLEFPDASFDLIIWEEVLEHFEEPLAALKEGKRALKAGGEFIISVPNLGSIRSRMFRLIGQEKRLSSPDHKQYFNRESLTALMNKAGFKIIALTSDYMPIPKLPLRFFLNIRKDLGRRYPSLGHHLIVYGEKL